MAGTSHLYMFQGLYEKLVKIHMQRIFFWGGGPLTNIVNEFTMQFSVLMSVLMIVVCLLGLCGNVFNIAILAR